jgi:hypothetical protein
LNQPKEYRIGLRLFMTHPTASSVSTGAPAMPPSEACIPLRRRGRPTINLNNRRVRAFISEHLSLSKLMEAHPVMDDVFTGAVRLQTVGEQHDRPLSRRRVFRVLQSCEVIETATVAQVLATGFEPVRGRSTIARYSGAARVTANAISRLLDLNPEWEVTTMERHALDASYLEDLAFAA